MFEVCTLILLRVLPAHTHSFLPFPSLAAEPAHPPFPKRLYINAGNTGAVSVSAVVLCPSYLIQGALDSY